MLFRSAQTATPPSIAGTPTVSPSRTPRPTRTPRVRLTKTIRPTKTPAITVTPTVAGTPVPQLNPGIVIKVQKMGYENWGRPKSMDDPNADFCGPFNDANPVLKLGISLAVINKTNQTWPTGTRSIHFFRPNGAEATWCYYNFVKGPQYPETKPGEAYMLSYLVFVERNERVGYLTFTVDGVGYARFDVPEDLPLP